MSNEVIIASVFGLVSTLIAGVFMPAVMELWRSKRTLRQKIRDAREGPYKEFIAAVERVQITLDMRAVGMKIKRLEYWEIFREMEQARAAIDIVGSLTTRVWAYRCRLAISGMDKTLLDGNADGRVYRAKLHEARKNLAERIRVELSLKSLNSFPEIQKFEDSVEGHKLWLENDVPDEARRAVMVPYAELRAWGSGLEPAKKLDD